MPRGNISKPAAAWQKALWNIVTYSWINVLIIFVPVSWAMEFSHQSDTIIFVMSALAVIPLATQL